MNPTPAAAPRTARPPRTDVRLSYYDATTALDLTQELVHLETAARVPADLDLTWLTRCLQGTEFRLVTAAVDGRLVGFAAANIVDEHIAIERLVVAASAIQAHPELAAALLQAVVDAARRPWADVVVPPAFPGLGVLLDQGWRPVVGGGDADGAIRLSAAHVDLP